MNEGVPTVVIIDEDEATREMAKRYLIDLGVRVEAYPRLDELEPSFCDHRGCILLDVHEGESSQADLHERLRCLAARLPVVVMSEHPKVSTAVALMEDGAISVLEKPFEKDALLSSVKKGIDHADERHSRAAQHEADAARLSKLTIREREVLAMVVKGEASKCICRTLGVSVRTIEKHRQHILKKTNAGSWAELVAVCERLAWKGGLVLAAAESISHPGAAHFLPNV